MRLGLRSFGSVLALLLLTASSGCDQEEEEGPEAVRMFTGQVDENLFVGLVSDDHNVVFYVCDGTVDAVSVGEWFQGPHDGGAFELTSLDADVTATGQLDSASGSGTLQLDGAALSFTLEPVGGGDAGLYFHKVHTSEVHQWGGWIVRDDGSIRGSVINRTTGGIAPAGDASPGDEITVDGVDFDVELLESADPQ